MSSPVGHSLAGLSLYFLWTPYKGWRQLWEQKGGILTAVTLANLPDGDMLVGSWIYGDRHILHRELTHSPFFAVLLALILSLFSLGRKGFLGPKKFNFFENLDFWRKALRYFILVFSHGVMDFFSGDVIGYPSGQGVALLYPWDAKKYTSPIALLPAVDLNLGIWAMDNWTTAAIELILFGGLLLGILLFKGRKFPP